MTSPELYKKYRPTTFKAMRGNPEVVKMLKNWTTKGTTPHCIMFTGGSGMGKTTLARIVAKKLNCGPADFKELNAAGQARGIDTIKAIEGQINLAPVSGDSRVWLIDEAHMLTKDAQNAVLKLLEDTPKHVYFMLCTTDPQKMLPTIKTRSSVIAVKALSVAEMTSLLNDVCAKENFEITEEVRDKIIEVSEGSSRQALVLLNQLLVLPPEDHLNSIENQNTKAQAIELCRMLMNKNTKWPECAKLLKALIDSDDFDPEGFRYMILGYASSILLNSKNDRAFILIDQFQGNYYDTKKAGLIADCWEVVHGAK